MKPLTPKYNLKVANLTDLQEIKRMCKAFFLSSIYNDKEYDADKVHDTILELLHDPANRVILLALRGDKPCAVLAATVAPLLFNASRIATEVVWWVDDKHRRSGVGQQLIEAYEYWAINIAKADYIQLCSLNGGDEVGQYYEKIGYKLTEKAYIKECKEAYSGSN